jgi:antitoxin component YwqK of YwqJK toxin-antitoxin module
MDVQHNTYKIERLVLSIVHPYAFDKNIEVEPELIKAVYYGQTMNGVPHGLGKLFYKDDVDIWINFEGMVTMTNGQVHGGPALFFKGDGYRESFDMMENGRPKEMTIQKQYNCDGNLGFLTPKFRKATNTSGWTSVVGHSLDGRYHGECKIFLRDGGVQYGEFFNEHKSVTEETYLNENGTLQVYQVEYSAQSDCKSQILPI